MKKILLALLLLIALPGRPYAEKPSEVTLRFGRQETVIRVVVEGPDELIRAANSSVSPSSLTIDFPSAFELKSPPEPLFAVAKKGNSLSITLKDVSDVKSYRLSSPARMVFDLKPTEKKAGNDQKQDQKTGQKPEQKNSWKSSAQPQPGEWTSAQAAKKTAQTQAQEKPLKIKTIVLDPGHGGYENGISEQDVKEKDLNLSLVRDLGNVFAKTGRTVYLTRKTDQGLPLSERAGFSGAKNPDLMVSIHASLSDKFVFYISSYEDANVDAAVRSFSLSSRQSKQAEKSRKMAEFMAGAIKKDLGADSVLRQLPLPLLWSMNTPAIVVEYPFFRNFVRDQKVRDKLVNALLRGVSAYEQQ